MLSTDKGEILTLLSKHIADSQSDFLEYVNTTFRQITDGFIKEDLGMLHKAEDTMRRKRDELKNCPPQGNDRLPQDRSGGRDGEEHLVPPRKELL